MMNRWEADPPLPGVWEGTLPELRMDIDFVRLKGNDVQSQLDEVRRMVKHSELSVMIGKEEACEYLLERLRKGDCNRLLQQAILSALAKLGTPDACPDLWAIAKERPDIRYQIEQMLVQWKNPLPLDDWRRRLQSVEGELRDVILAVNGIAAVGDREDAKLLERLLRKSGLPIAAKVPVARALGQLESSGLEPFAEEIFQSNHQQRELLASYLLARHASPRAAVVQRQMVDLSHDPAAAIAYQSLSEFHPSVSRELALGLCKHRDYRVRNTAIDVLSRNSDEKELVALMSCLEDENLKLRDKAREILVEKAKNAESQQVILGLLGPMLENPKSFAIEQGIILSVQLMQRNRCPRFLELLDYPEENVRIRAGWGLQELANTTEIVEAVFAYTLPISEQLKNGKPLPHADGFKLAHLLHVFGTNRFKPAEVMLRLYVPELDQRMNPIPRASAIWSLGLILEGTQDTELCEQLQERFLDLGPPAEYENVRYACAISMGRIAGMKDTSFFQNTGEMRPYKIAEAAEWAIAKQAEVLKERGR
jgi:HEAT repeat protein